MLSSVSRPSFSVNHGRIVSHGNLRSQLSNSSQQGMSSGRRAMHTRSTDEAPPGAVVSSRMLRSVERNGVMPAPAATQTRSDLAAGSSPG